MRAPLDYTRTSQRPTWADLPAELRSAIEERLGSPVVSARGTGAGFTQGFAAVLGTAWGGSHFVKAASLSTDVSSWYRKEALFTAALPAAVPSARVSWHGDLAGHFVLCLEAIDGARTSDLPWARADLDAALRSHAVSAAALAEPPAELLALEPTPMAEVIDGSLRNWREIASGSVELPEPALARHLAELAALEERFDELTRHATGLMHCDLRLDNIVLDSRGQAWICDWNWLCTGPAWVDLISLLLSAEASDLGTDELFSTHATAAGVPGDALDAGLAAFGGFYLTRGSSEPVPGSPALRVHQAYYARLALRWLARRRAWADLVLVDNQVSW